MNLRPVRARLAKFALRGDGLLLDGVLLTMSDIAAELNHVGPAVMISVLALAHQAWARHAHTRGKHDVVQPQASGLRAGPPEEGEDLPVPAGGGCADRLGGLHL